MSAAVTVSIIRAIIMVAIAAVATRGAIEATPSVIGRVAVGKDSTPGCLSPGRSGKQQGRVSVASGYMIKRLAVAIII